MYVTRRASCNSQPRFTELRKGCPRFSLRYGIA